MNLKILVKIFKWSSIFFRITPYGKIVRIYDRYDLIKHTFNIRRTREGDKIVDYPHVAGASPVGPAPTPSSFSTSMDW